MTFIVDRRSYDTNVEDIKFLELMIDDITLGKYQLFPSVFTLKLGGKYSNQVFTGTLTDIHIHLINVNL